jgi:hypothetical protein
MDRSDGKIGQNRVQEGNWASRVGKCSRCKYWLNTARKSWSNFTIMGKKTGFAFSERLVAACLGGTLLCSCSTPSSKPTQLSPVRRVEVTAASQEELAKRARQIANQMYPGVCSLLSDGKCTFPSDFDIVLKPQLPNGIMGQTTLKKIQLNCAYLDEFCNEPGLLEQVLVHEMGHVAQHYYKPIVGSWLVSTHHPAVYWVEGLADYLCCKLLRTNSWACLECGSTYPHYRDGYSCTGAFLLFIESNFSPGIVAKLNTALRRGNYSEDFFLKMTGKELPALWEEFQKTSAFTPSAARMLEVRQELGFVNDKPPKDIELRLTDFLNQHADPQTIQLMSLAEIPSMKRKDVQSRLALICYFTQPGGTAEAFISNLQRKEQLPGFFKGERGMIYSFTRSCQLDLIFPASRTFTASKKGDASTYHYTVARSSEESAWSLQRAWRTSPDGALAAEYNIP